MACNANGSLVNRGPVERTKFGFGISLNDSGPQSSFFSPKQTRKSGVLTVTPLSVELGRSAGLRASLRDPRKFHYFSLSALNFFRFGATRLRWAATNCGKSTSPAPFYQLQPDLSWPARGNLLYRATPNLTPPAAWRIVVSMFATNTNILQIIDTKATNNTSFYRVRIQ